MCLQVFTPGGPFVGQASVSKALAIVQTCRKLDVFGCARLHACQPHGVSTCPEVLSCTFCIETADVCVHLQVSLGLAIQPAPVGVAVELTGAFQGTLNIPLFRDPNVLVACRVSVKHHGSCHHTGRGTYV